MNIRLQKTRLRDLLHKRNLLLSLVTVLLMINGIQALYTLFRDQRIVVMPADLKQEVWLKKNQVSASYLEEMALMFASLILESSPESAAYKRDIILRYAAPSDYGALKRTLLEDEKRLKAEHVTTSFHPQSIKVDSPQLTVELTGALSRFVGEKRISQSKDTYRFQFAFKAGRLSIKSFKLISSDHKES